MRQKEFRAVAKQLLPDLPGWRLKGPLLIWPPVDHTLRAVCFEPSGFDRRSFYLSVFLLPLCVRHEYVSFNMGKRLGFSWEADDPQLLSNLLRAMRAEATPFLEGLDTPQDVVAVILARWRRSEDLYVHQGIAYLLALYGELDQAVDALDHLLKLSTTGFYRGLSWADQMAVEARTLKSKLLEDPDDARSMLREWEEESRRNLKVEEFTSAALAASQRRSK